MTPQEFEKRILHLRKVIAPDDIYIFTESLLQMAIHLTKTLAAFINMETALEIDPDLREIINNLVAYEEQYKEGNTSSITVQYNHDED